MKKQRQNKGFTLIELMIVVAIIGILSAIAVPSFIHYRQRSYDKRAQNVLKNITSAQSAYNSKRERYTPNNVDIMAIDLNIPAPNTSDGVEWNIIAADAISFTASAKHSLGSGVTHSADQSAVITIH